MNVRKSEQMAAALEQAGKKIRLVVFPQVFPREAPASTVVQSSPHAMRTTPDGIATDYVTEGQAGLAVATPAGPR